MINLNKTEKLLINFCKGRLDDKYYTNKGLIEDIKPLFLEIYGWNPDEDNNYHDFLNCLFNKLLELHYLICDKNSIKDVFKASFEKRISSKYDLPIERGIVELCSIIRFNEVSENGYLRYEL